MKTQSIALVVAGLVCCFSSSLNAQEQETALVWARIPAIEQLKLIKTEGKLTSVNPAVQQLITDYTILSIEQAVPASRQSVLQEVYELSCQCNEHDLLAAVARIPNVFEGPELGPKYTPLYEPNDYSLVYTTDYALDLINAQSAWDVTTGDSSVIIGVSDQNYYIEHEELIGKIHHYDTTNTSPQTHGTAVAITAAGNTDNITGKSSIGFNSELALYRMSFNDILTASYSGSRVINVSWASGCYPSNYIQMVMDEAYANGSVVVCAAGNGGTCGGPANLVYPAACNNVISVTSIGPNDNHERYPGDINSTHQHNSTVDIAAPGYDMALSTAPGAYITGNGSSFAAPLVSGTIALMLSVDTCLTVDDIEYILAMTAVDIDSLNPGYEGLIGNGRLDAGAALAMTATYNACGIEEEDPEGEEGEEGEGEGEEGEGEGEGGDDGLPDLPGMNGLDAKDEVETSEENETSVATASLSATEVNVFPNPVQADGAIRIQSEADGFTYRIHAIDGSVVMSGEQNEEKIMLNGMSRGTYMLHVQLSSGETIIKRLVVQ